MCSLEDNKTKRIYLAPKLECVKLDNEISLQLQSAPPPGEGEGGAYYKAPEYFNNDPFKMA